MDKYYQLLNALLDEIDYLEVQLQEAIHEGDYTLAAHLQKAYHFKKRKLWNYKGIFDPQMLSPYQASDKFRVHHGEEATGLQYLLGDFLAGKLSSITLCFEKDIPASHDTSLIEISLSRQSEKQGIHFVMQNFASQWQTRFERHQIAILQQIGWQIGDIAGQRFYLMLSSKQALFQESIMVILARTYFEVINQGNETLSTYVRVKI